MRGPLSFSEADITLTGLASLFVICFDGARPRGNKLLFLIHRCQPKTVEVGKVVTGATPTLALYEGMSSEILKAATRRGQRLATTFVTCPRVLTGGKQAFRGVDSIFHQFHTNKLFVIALTRRKEYPVHRLLQPVGHAGTV